MVIGNKVLNVIYIMAQSIKLKNAYFDTDGIAHEREKLKTYLNNKVSKILYSEMISSSSGEKQYLLPSNDGIYIIIIHTNSGNGLRFDVVMEYNGTLYTTTLHTSNYVTLTYSGTTVKVTVQYTNYLKIIKL